MYGREAQQFDGWDRMANNHLFGYIARRVAARKAVPMTDRQMQPFLEAKRAWAEEMRAEAASHTLPDDAGRDVWSRLMQAAQNAHDDMQGIAA